MIASTIAASVAAGSEAPVKLTVATLATTETLTVRPLPVVTTALPSPSATSEPSMTRTSLLPSVTLVTVRVSEVMVWPAS